jgi:hypothetical protein
LHGPRLWPSFETRASFDKLRSALLRMRSAEWHQYDSNLGIDPLDPGSNNPHRG